MPNKTHEENEKIQGSGILQLISDLIEETKKSLNLVSESLAPDFGELKDEDCDDDDPVVKSFKKDHDGFGGLVRIIKLSKPEVIEKLSSTFEALNDVRTAHRAESLRKAFQMLQRLCQKDHVVMLERMASSDSQESLSRGGLQMKLLGQVNNLLKDAPANEIPALSKVREAVLAGSDAHFDAASYRVKNLFAHYVSPANVRLAYTTLSTQFDGKFMMCPKGNDVFGHPVQMEANSCINNCIDGRTNKSGEVSCAYAAWLKTSETHGKVMGRFEEIRHPDNEANSMNIAPGERTAPGAESAYMGTEMMFDMERTKKKPAKDQDHSLERKLDDAAPGVPGHRASTASVDPQVVVFNSAKMKKDKKEDFLTTEEKLEDMPAGSPGRREIPETPHPMHKEASFEDSLDDEREGTSYDDETIAAMLEDENVGLTDDEIEMAFNEWLDKSREK